MDAPPSAFLSTLSLRRATSRHNLCPRKSKISIHALLAESDARRNAHMSRTPISIHALLAESDRHWQTGHSLTRHFYPRSPCGERPRFRLLLSLVLGLFLSTLSLRRATRPEICDIVQRTYFYPRSPCGERPSSVKVSLSGSTISIHALLAESDTWARGSRVTYVEFLSTLSLRRATANLRRNQHQRMHFYPRSPCGERQQKCTKQWGTFAHMK